MRRSSGAPSSADASFTLTTLPHARCGRHGFYRPAGYHLMRAGLDGEGRIIAWSQHLVNASRGHYLRWSPEKGQTELADPGELEPYDLPAGVVPNMRIGYTAIQSRIPRGQWRAVEPSATVFVTQSMIDELAHIAKRDPLAFQLSMLEPPRKLKYYGGEYDTARLAAVFRTAAAHGDWGKPLPTGRGRGIAGSYSNGAYVAHVVDVEALPNDSARVTRVVTAADCGLAPRIDVHFVDSGEDVPHGIGEGALPSIAPAAMNALFAATGRRLRALPLVRAPGA